jgi:hypothetical protein
MLKNEEEYKVECTKFLNELLNKNSDLDAELQKDTAEYGLIYAQLHHVDRTQACQK